MGHMVIIVVTLLFKTLPNLNLKVDLQCAEEFTEKYHRMKEKSH